jgi:hypothetical protein
MALGHCGTRHAACLPIAGAIDCFELPFGVVVKKKKKWVQDATQVTVAAVRERTIERHAIGPHACSSFKRAGVGVIGILRVQT